MEEVGEERPYTNTYLSVYRGEVGCVWTPRQTFWSSPTDPEEVAGGRPNSFRE